jgi:hypothetical protein
MLETHFADIITEKRHNFDPSTPPACAENLHFMLNGETRRAPGLQSPAPRWLGKTGTSELRGTMVLPQTSLGQSSIAPPDRLTSTREKRETDK